MRVGPVENQGSNAIISRSRVGNITHVRVAGVIDETFPLTRRVLAVPWWQVC